MVSAQGIRAGAAFIELYLHDNRFVRGLASASKRLQAFGASIRAMGLQIAAAGAAVLLPMLGAAKQFAATGDQLDKMRARTGFSAESLSELGFAAEQGGASIDQLDRSLAAMARFSVMVERGLKTSTDLLDMLGVSVDRFKQASPDERFKLMAEAISQIEDPTLRAGIALNVFGRSGRDLLPMLEGGRASIEALQDEARRLGITMTDEDASSAAELTDAMNRLKRQFQAIVVQVGAALAPALVDLADNIAPLITSVINWIKENRALIVVVFKIAAAVVSAGLALILLGGIISGAGSALGGIVTVIGAVGTAIVILGKIVAFLVTPIGLTILAVTALAGYLLYTSGLGAKALKWLAERFDVLKSRALAAWKGISNALMAGDLALAGKIVWLTLKMEWKRGVHYLNGQWIGFKDAFLSIANEAIYGAARLFNDGWAAVEIGWVETIAFLSDSWSIFTNLLTRTWQSTVGFIQKAWVRLKSMFDSDIDVEAEVNRINDETASANESADKQTLKAIGDRDKQRRERRDQIEADRAGAETALSEMQQEQNAQRQKQFAGELATTEQELADARNEWQAAIAEAAEKRAAIEPERMQELQDDLSLSGMTVGEEQRKVEAKGTFNALAVRGLGADSLAERTAKATEDVAENTQDLLDRAKQGGLVFAK